MIKQNLKLPWRDRTGIVFADSDSQYFALFFVEKS